MKYLITLIFLCLVVVGNQVFAGSYNIKSSVPVLNSTTINHPVPVNITVSSGLASQTYVTNVQLTATATSNAGARLPMAVTQWNPFNTSVTIGSGANQTTTFSAGPLVFFSPSTGVTGSGTGTYTIGGTVYTSDGTATPITVGATIKINPVPLPAYERQ